MLQLSLRVSQSELERVEAILLAQGAVSVTLRDAGDEAIYEPAPGETPLWSAFEVTALFEADSDMDRVRSCLDQALQAPRAVGIAPLEERDWVRAWMDRFGPMDFGQGLWVCPTGMEAPPQARVIVRLDPGLAFGTGTHATTALCLEWLASHPPRGARIVDYGCGSGILSLAAAKLGAAQIMAVDIDPQALQATRDNADRNGIPPDVLRTGLAGEMGGPAVDLILANILSNTLTALYPEMVRLSRPGTRILLSGILAGQAQAVARVYAQGFRLQPPRSRADWVLIEGVRS